MQTGRYSEIAWQRCPARPCWVAVWATRRLAHKGQTKATWCVVSERGSEFARVFVRASEVEPFGCACTGYELQKAYHQGVQRARQIRNKVNLFDDFVVYDWVCTVHHSRQTGSGSGRGRIVIGVHLRHLSSNKGLLKLPCTLEVFLCERLKLICLVCGAKIQTNSNELKRIRLLEESIFGNRRFQHTAHFFNASGLGREQ